MRSTRLAIAESITLMVLWAPLCYLLLPSGSTPGKAKEHAWVCNTAKARQGECNGESWSREIIHQSSCRCKTGVFISMKQWPHQLSAINIFENEPQRVHASCTEQWRRCCAYLSRHLLGITTGFSEQITWTLLSLPMEHLCSVSAQTFRKNQQREDKSLMN